MSSTDDSRPVYAGFFGVMGASAAIIFSCKFYISDDTLGDLSCYLHGGVGLVMTIHPPTP